MMAALAIILDFVKIGGFWAYGGSVSLAMLPILLMAFRRGLKAGLITGFIVGAIQMFYGYYYHPVQIVLDYTIAYGVVGFAGLFKFSFTSSRQKQIIGIIFGVFLASFLRFIAHFLSGIVFFAEYAPEDMNPTVYSVIYNASYMLPAFILCASVLVLLYSAAPRLFKGK